MTALRTAKAKDCYFELVKRFPLQTIQSDEHHSEALEMVDTLFGRKRSAGEEVYLETLLELIERYEDEIESIPPSTDAEILRFILDTRELTAAEFSRQTGISKALVSRILSGDKSFTPQIIGKIASTLGIDRGSLAQNF